MIWYESSRVRVHTYYSVWDRYPNTSNPKTDFVFCCLFWWPHLEWTNTISTTSVLADIKRLFDNWKWKPLKSNQTQSQYLCWIYSCIYSWVFEQPYRFYLIRFVVIVIVIILSISFCLCLCLCLCLCSSTFNDRTIWFPLERDRSHIFNGKPSRQLDSH